MVRNKYENKSVRELKKILDAHRKKPEKTRPDADASSKRKKKLKDDIKKLKFKLAELKYDNDQIQLQKNQYQSQQDEWQNKVKSSKAELQKYRQETQAVSKQLREALGSQSKGMRRIADPDKKLKELQSELATEKRSLQFDDLSANQERSAMRNIKVLEAQIEVVKKYQQENVGEVFKNRDEAKQKENAIQDEHNSTFESFQKAREANTEIWNKLRENLNDQQTTKDTIKELNVKLGKIDTQVKEAMQAFEDWRREERDLMSLIAEKKDMEEFKGSSETSKPATTDSKPTQAAAAKTQEDKADDRPTVQELRAAAQLEYERIQKNIQQAKAPVDAPASSDPASESVPSVKVNDPHRAEKELCQQLIAYCKQNMPAEPTKDASPKKKKKKRKKKKIRLSHKPVNFTNFAKVGVGIPIFSTDLAKCIKALEDKISSYDNPDEQEDVKEQSV